MEAVLKKQTDLLSRLENDSKQDKIIQLAQLYEERRIDADGDRTEDQLKDLNKNIKALNENTGDNLNSNVVKLFKELQKTTKGINSRPLDESEVGRITATGVERRQFNTLQPRVENFKEGVKDFFTMRGFLDKTGIIPRNSGGIFSEYLDRGEAKKNYIEQRMATKGTTFGSRETFAKQFDQQQRIQGEISKNEKEIARLKASGATEIGLKRSGLLDKQASLATELAKVDPSVRPSGFDAKTGRVKVKPETATEQQAKAKIIPFSGAGADSSGAISGANEESMLEQNRMVAEQTGLLVKIEENTRALKGGLSSSGGNQQPTPAAEEGGGFGISDMLGGSGRLGKIARTAGRGLMTGARAAGNFLMKRAGPLAAVAAVGAGAYEGYQGWNAAGDKQEAAKQEIKAKVESGEITQGEAAQLTKKVDEQATVEKGAAAGKGTGMALGGAAGALKGAAAGAAIGSVVPVVGTVVGGAIGATVGAIGGSWLGGKAGEWVGEKAGAAKNWVGGFFGGKKEEANVSPGEKTAQVLQKTAGGVSPTNVATPEDAKNYDSAYTNARSSGASVSEAKQIAREHVRVMKEKKAVEVGVTMSPTNIAPATVPTMGNIVAKQSGDNEQAKLDAGKTGGTTAVVAAPTINNNQTVQNNPVKLPPRNTDSTVNKYMQSRWAY